MILEAICAWAERTPARTAVTYHGQDFSYQTFAHLILLARGFLARRHLKGPGMAIIATRQLLDSWVLILALRSLGLTTVPVSSAEAIKTLDLPDLKVVLTSPRETWPGLQDVCDGLDIPLVACGLDGQAALPIGRDPQPCGGHVLQTSGTTGTYKKVLVNPAFEAGFLEKRRRLLGLEQDTVFNGFNFTTWTGAGYKAQVCTWMAGGRVILHQQSPVWDALRYPGQTHAVLVPNMLAEFLAAPAGAYPRSETLQLSITGGTITQRQIDAAKARITPHLFNRLGATETSIFAFTRLDTADDHRWHLLVPGQPVEVVDEADRPVGNGQFGRVRVGTGGGPTSYMNDLEATARFFKDGYFYPGDLGVIRADGRLALHGRLTDVINVAGAKVAPAPVEDQIRQLFGFSGVCLFSMQDHEGDEVVHVVVETASAFDASQVTAATQAALGGLPRVEPASMPTLPRNAMGKVLRKEVQDRIAVNLLREDRD